MRVRYVVNQMFFKLKIYLRLSALPLLCCMHYRGMNDYVILKLDSGFPRSPYFLEKSLLLIMGP